MNIISFSIFVISLNFSLTFYETESFIIPALIFKAWKNGWFKKNDPRRYLNTRPLHEYINFKSSPSTQTAAITTAEASTTTEISLDLVEYIPNNPCGYGPSPAFNPRDEWLSHHTLEIPRVLRKERYIYSLADVGNDDLGYFLLYSLQAMEHPNFYSHKEFFKSNNKPKYNYYKTHRFDFNGGYIKANTTIEASHIIECTEDSTLICPHSTMSLCTSNGAILCVANYTVTIPCRSEQIDDLVCVTAIIPSKKRAKIQWIKEDLPCLSSAWVMGYIGFNNNSTVYSKEKEKEELRQQQRKEEEMRLREEQLDNEARDFVEDLENGKDTYKYPIFSSDFLNRIIKVSSERYSTAIAPAFGNEHTIKNVETKSSVEIPQEPDLDHSDIEPTVHDFCVTIVALPGRKRI